MTLAVTLKAQSLHPLPPNTLLPTSRLYSLLCALVYLATLYIFLIVTVFIPQRTPPPPGVLAVDVLADCVLLGDSVVHARWVAFVRDGVFVAGRGEVSRRFWRGRGWRDVVSLLPVHWGFCGSHVYFWVRTTRFLRMWGFWEWADVWETQTTMHGPMKLMRIANIAGVLGHLLGCVYWLVSNQIGAGSPWGQPASVREAGAFAQYVDAIFWSASSMSPIGTALVDRVPGRTMEMLVSLGTTVTGVVLYALVIGTVATTLANLSENRQKHRKNVSLVRSLMTRKRVSGELQVKIRSFMEYEYTRHKGFDDAAVLALIPPHLRKELLLEVSRGILSRVKLFMGAPEAFLRALVLKLAPETYSPGDLVIRCGDVGAEMYFLIKGHCEAVLPDGKVVNHMRDGDFFGEIALVSSSAVRTVHVRAATYCDILRLDAKDLMDVLALFPEQAAQMQAVAGQRYQRTHGVLVTKGGESKASSSSQHGHIAISTTQKQETDPVKAFEAATDSLLREGLPEDKESLTAIIKRASALLQAATAKL